MSGSLAGITVLVTRPAAQAARFIELATHAGAECIAYPTLVIERVPIDAAMRDELTRTEWDWAIYTSANAVDAALAALGRLPARHTAAVGRATARSLEQRGVSVELRPETANSEGLLALPPLREVAGQRVLLVKGTGGRDLLRATLTARGAIVRTLEAYRRAHARPTGEAQSALRAALARAEVRLVVVVTSAEVLEALLDLSDAEDLRKLRTATLLAPGSRVADVAAAAGWTGPIVQAATAEDEAMIRALQAARSTGEPPAA
ncbi:MAG TPA: uroporphyrinogen-III synthase [Steroidobacteraceae bacterium]|nr:uroporphyrinogen-III synthase [Steroidobacteraceae bacterium]